MKKILILLFLTLNILFGVSIKDGLDALKTNDYQKAYDIFSQSCKLKNPNGCYNLAVMYDFAEGIPKDFIKAAELYKMA